MDKKYMSYNNLIDYDERLKDYISASLNNFLETIYPVGSIYLSMSPTSPSILFGGTWEQIKDTFLLAAGNNYSVGSTGGEAEHTLTVDEMPSHRHDFKFNYSASEYKKGDKSFQATQEISMEVLIDSSSELYVQAAGGNQPHNNMPPYLAVYMWKRTG